MLRSRLTTTTLLYTNTKPNSYKLYSTCKSFNSQKLLAAVADLEKFDIRLKNFPTMVFFGPQSSGKSSAIQAITGDYILPTDMKIATRKPTHITTLRSDNVKYKVGDREFFTAKETSNEIDRLNRNDHVEKIDVVVKSPHVHNSVFIDLPGLFSISDNDTDDHFRKKVKQMSTAYTSNRNFIPMIVHAAPSDPATNAAIKLVSKIDRRNDAFGILTKFDMVKNQKTAYLERMLKGVDYKLGHGYCAVVLPNDLDIERGVSVEEKIKEEEEFFKKYPNVKPSGVPILRKMISDIQATKIMEHIPAILRDVDVQMDSLKNSQNFLSSLMNGNNKSLSKRLHVMINQLVDSSQQRAVFEDKLYNNLRTELIKYLDTNDSEKVDIVRSLSYINSGIVKIYQQNNDVDVENKFKHLFSYGAGTPIFIDNSNLREAFKNEAMLGLALSLIEPQINDNLGTKRIMWNKQLNSYFSTLLKDNTIHNIIKNITFKLLLEYICDEGQLSDPKSQKFAEYMVNEIGNEAFESKIKYSITAMINLEKRPNVSATEIIRYFIKKHPEILRMPNTFFTTPSVQKVVFDIYEKDWMDSYFNVVIDNLTVNCYRNIAVNLLDKMVRKLLEMTMDMFHKENAAKEHNKVNEKMKKLVEIKEILLTAKSGSDFAETKSNFDVAN
ncbi:dynamin family protein [Tupanvirus soda lake]|uniref:Dynamin family protein n=2 Tax=Tupanvirus TaxID=2094720 RepID=A0A6N1NV05_9VIRU|nr:dynamin family protein [Tupanvirus soda lake]QKU35298.1 dynamin family protein [Tupanvirus soda lake]